ncbi:MAG: hypothetical protein GX640_19040 [Fibrobacter sp.]|nr:hypothetical protein [Fibrobacter sp.]
MMRDSVIITTLVLLLFSSCTMFIRDPEKAYSKGVELIQKKKSKNAYKYFLAATKKQPDSPKYHWAAAQTAQNQNAAMIHTEMAWKSGMKSVPVMAALLQLSLFTTKEQRIEKMLSLFGELPDTIQTPALKAELFSQLGASDSALAIWKKQYATAPSAVLAFKIGRELSAKTSILQAGSFLRVPERQKFSMVQDMFC